MRSIAARQSKPVGITKEKAMSSLPRTRRELAYRAGKIKYGIFAWLLGLPLPIVLIALFYRGCDF
jgi:hypothetical protein